MPVSASEHISTNINSSTEQQNETCVVEDSVSETAGGDVNGNNIAELVEKVLIVPVESPIANTTVDKEDVKDSEPQPMDLESPMEVETEATKDDVSLSVVTTSTSIVSVQAPSASVNAVDSIQAPVQPMAADITEEARPVVKVSVSILFLIYALCICLCFLFF